MAQATEKKSSLKEIATLSVNIKPEALQEVISHGRLLELSAIMAREAAAQITAQLVDSVANAALNKQGLSSATVAASFIFDGGDFGTVPPRPHFGVGPIRNVVNELQRFASSAGEAGG